MDRSGRVALVMTTVGGPEVAERVVRTLLDERLVACGNILPDVLSIYRWEGKVEREAEVVVLLKTATSELDRLFARLAELHPYAVPEMVAFHPEGVYLPYSRWVMDSTKVSA